MQAEKIAKRENNVTEKKESVRGKKQDLSSAVRRVKKGGGRRASSHRLPSKIDDMKAKLERSRQSARECRARKKLRYQYLEELVAHREEAVLLLRQELEIYKKWCKEIDDGHIPEELQKKMAENKDLD